MAGKHNYVTHMIQQVCTILMIAALAFGADGLSQSLAAHINVPEVSPRQKVQQASLELTAPKLEPVPAYQGKGDIVDANAAIAVDADTATVLYEKEADTRLPLASITKLMVALVVLEEADLSAVHTVKNPNRMGANMKLQQGEQITLRNLLRGSLIPSANDATRELAKAVVGSEQAMVDKMNAKAQELNLKNTEFFNVTGLDREDDASIEQENTSTVFEIAAILKEAHKNQTIRSIVGTKTMTVSSVDGEIQHELKSTNKLLGEVQGMKGGKTGYTYKAGQSLATSSTRNGHTVITVVLNSPDRYAETKSMIQEVYNNTQWNDCQQGKDCGILQ